LVIRKGNGNAIVPAYMVPLQYRDNDKMWALGQNEQWWYGAMPTQIQNESRKQSIQHSHCHCHHTTPAPPNYEPINPDSYLTVAPTKALTVDLTSNRKRTKFSTCVPLKSAAPHQAPLCLIIALRSFPKEGS
jgi:hypothetical protein